MADETPIRSAFSSLVTALTDAAKGNAGKLAIVAGTVIALALIWKLL